MSTHSELSIIKETFGKLRSGEIADIYTLTNNNGMKIKITNFGGALTELWIPDKYGKMEDVTLGYSSPEGYEKDDCFLGFIIGRYANRIGNAKFTLGGVEYMLTPNNGPNLLHGGKGGFNTVLWEAEGIQTEDNVSVILTYLSKDGDQGFPGNLTATVKYTLTNDNEIQIDYSAVSDKITIVNLTSHAYFNLSGQGSGDILKHEVFINANAFTPTDDTAIPTGEMRSVEGTPFDFTKPKRIGEHINAEEEQIILGRGYDHNWVLNKTADEMSLAVRAFDPVSGRVLEVMTTEPGVQFYSGNFLDGSIVGKDYKRYEKRSGFCLETQHFPDSPNKPEFPSTELKVGETYSSKTIYKFSIIKE